MARSPDPETDPSFSECEAPPGEDANGRNEGEGWCAAVLAETPKVLVGFSDSKALSTGTRVVQALRRNGGRLALAVDEKQDGSEEDEEVEGEDEDEGFLLAPHSPLLAKSGSKPASILGSEPCTRGASPKIETGFQLGNVHDPDNAHEDPLHSFSVDDAGFTHSQMEYLVRADASEAALTTTVEPARVAWRDGTWENDAGSPLCKPAVAHASISRGDSFDASQIEFAITDTQLQLLIEEPSLKSEAKEECTDILAGQRNSSDNSMCVNAVVARLDSAVSHNGRMNNVDDPALNSNYDPGNLATSSLLGESLVPTDNSGYAFEQTGEGQSPITSAGPDLSIDAFAPDFDITATQLQYVVDNDVPPALENESVPLDHGTHAQLDVMEFVEMDILAGETSSLPMKNTKFNVQHSNETCDSTSQNHQREQLEEHFNGPAPANAAISPTPLHAHLPPVPAVPSNSHPNSSPSAKYHRSPREPLSNTSPSPNTHSDPARDARAARTPPLATRRTSKRRRETISGALPDNKRAPPREKVRGEPRRRSLGFDVFRSMARAAAAAGKEEEERLGSADVAVAVWERTPPMGKGKGKRGLGAAARANEKEKGESEEGKARGILGRAKKAKAARDVSVEAGCAGLEMKVPQVLPHEENISEHELLGYLESGAMDLELDDFVSPAPRYSKNEVLASDLPGTTTPSADEPSEPPVSVAFSTGRFKTIEIKPEKLEFGKKMIASLADDEVIEQLGLTLARKRTGGPVALSLADMAARAGSGLKSAFPNEIPTTLAPREAKGGVFTTGNGKALAALSTKSQAIAYKMFADIDERESKPRLPAKEMSSIASQIFVAPTPMSQPSGFRALPRPPSFRLPIPSVQNSVQKDPHVKLIQAATPSKSNFTPAKVTEATLAVRRGNFLTPSETGQRHAAALFEDILEDTPFKPGFGGFLGDAEDSLVTGKRDYTLEFSGFATALGAKLDPVATEVALKAKQMMGVADASYMREFQNLCTFPESNMEPKQEDSSSNMKVTGFMSGRGKSLAPISKQNLTAAENRWRDSYSTGFLTGSGAKLPSKSAAELATSEQLLSPMGAGKSLSTPRNSGFATGAGRTLAPPPRQFVLFSEKLLSVNKPEEATESSSEESHTMKEILNNSLSHQHNIASANISSAVLSYSSKFNNPVMKIGTPIVRAIQPGTPTLKSTITSLTCATNLATSLARRTLQSGMSTPSPNLAGYKIPLSTTKKFKPPSLMRSVASPQMTSLPGSKLARLAPPKLFDLTGKKIRKKLQERAHEGLHPLSYDALAEKGIPDAVLNINSVSAQKFHFVKGGELWGPEEAKHELLEKGASDKCVTAVWVSNHYRWIVWKLAGMVRSFPYLHETIWTPLYVVEQLLFRYEKEYAGGKRSCLKQIIEGDAPVELLMVLCVSRIIINGRDISSENLELLKDSSYLALELTDGWYRLNAQIDEVLSKAIRKNSITIGQKLLIYGAQLLGSAGSSTPLEAGDSLQLRLFANSTRRERWHAKLGFQRQSRPFQLALGHVAVQGGPVALVDAIIMRKFELCFVETNVDGTKTTRNEAEEEVERMRRLNQLECECQRILMEQSKLGSGYTEMEDIKQLALELVPERKVSSVIRYELCDYPPEGAGETSSSTAMLTVWHPEAGMLETLKEGKRIKFLGLVPDTFGHASTSHIKLKMGKKKTFVEVPATKGQVERSAYQPRKYISMAELESMESGRYFDVIAVVVAVSESFLQVADSSSEHVLQIESRSRRSVIPKIGDIVCFKNLVFVFRNSRVLYSKLEPEYGYQVLTMGHIEKAARPAMQNFLSTSSFTEACERAIISRDRANAKSYVSVAETYHFKNIRGGTGGDTEPDTLTVIFGDSGDRNLFVRSKSRRMLRLGWGEFVTRVTGSKDEGGKHRLLECIVSFLTCLGKHLNRADLGGFNYSVLDEYLLSLALGEHVLNWSRLSEFGPEEETEMHEIWALMCHELSEVFNCA